MLLTGYWFTQNVSFVVVAKAPSLLAAVTFTKHHGICRAYFESDALQLIQAVNSSQAPYSLVIQTIVSDIQHIVASD